MLSTTCAMATCSASSFSIFCFCVPATSCIAAKCAFSAFNWQTNVTQSLRYPQAHFLGKTAVRLHVTISIICLQCDLFNTANLKAANIRAANARVANVDSIWTDKTVCVHARTSVPAHPPSPGLAWVNPATCARKLSDGAMSPPSAIDTSALMI